MPDLKDGESVHVQGSARQPYELKNVAGVYSCTCPAWRNQSRPIDQRSCKHLRAIRGDEAEQARIGCEELPAKRASVAKAKAPPLLLAERWDNETDLTDYFLSEKLDGVRAYWTGDRFLSRQGNEFHAPAWFTCDLPSCPLDGELWIARKSFQRTVSIVRRKQGGDLWREIRFVAFDAPESTDPFEARQDFLQAAFRSASPQFARVLPQTRCEGIAHLKSALAEVESVGGEGLMLRQPGSLYEAGRSQTLLKVKTFHDADAEVIEHQPGRGRHKGRLGALRVRLQDGTEFSVGTGFTDRQRESPPAIGSKITFRFQEFTAGGVPRFPSFVRARSDTE